MKDNQDKQQVRAFFNTIFPTLDGYVEIRQLPSGKQDFFKNTEKALDHALSANSKSNIYFGVNQRVRDSGKNEDVPLVYNIIADLDFKDYPQEVRDKQLEEFPLKPTVLVHSGGGYQAHWLLKKPIIADEAKCLMKRLHKHLKSDPVNDPARILRVPGTLNYKYDPPRPVRVVHISGERFSPQDFYKNLPEEETPPKQETSTADRESTIGREPPLSSPEEPLGENSGRHEKAKRVIGHYASHFTNGGYRVSEEWVRQQAETWFENPRNCTAPLHLGSKEDKKEWSRLISDYVKYRESWDDPDDYQQDSENGSDSDGKIHIPKNWNYINFREIKNQGGFEPWEHQEPGVLTVGQSHHIVADSHVGKTWLGLGFAANALKRGQIVFYIDFENGPKSLFERLELLQVPKKFYDNFFPFCFPEISPQQLPVAYKELLLQAKPDLIVGDSAMGMLSAIDAKENEADDIERFGKCYYTPAKQIDSTILVLEHPGHSDKKRARGNSRKTQLADIEYRGYAKPRISPESPGKVYLELTKDCNTTLDIRVGDKLEFLVGGSDPFKFELSTFVKPKGLNKWEELIFEYLKRKGEKGASYSFIGQDVKDSKGKTIPEGSISRTLNSLEDKHHLIHKGDDGLWRCNPSVFKEDDLDFNVEDWTD